MTSIGPHFYALAPAIQAIRIEEFASQILTRNPTVPLSLLSNRIRGALRSMGSKKATPTVRAIEGGLEIDGASFKLTISPNGSHLVVPEDTTP